MSGGQAVKLDRVNIDSVLHGDYVYVQVTGFGATLDQCDQGLEGPLSTIGGGLGPFESTTAAKRTALNYPSAQPISALALASLGLVDVIAAGTQIPAPDFSINSTQGGESSYRRCTLGADPIDWVGGIADPKDAGGAKLTGAKIQLYAAFGAGKTINIFDSNVGGTVQLPYPMIAWGFGETLEFTWDSQLRLWNLTGRGSSYFVNGGNNLGGRVIRIVNSAAVVMIYQFAAALAGAPTPGVGCMFDVSADVEGSNGTISATWLNAYVVTDGANNILTSNKGIITGTNGGAPPAGWDISFSTTGSFAPIISVTTADAGIISRWRVNNLRVISPPFSP